MAMKKDIKVEEEVTSQWVWIYSSSWGPLRMCWLICYGKEEAGVSPGSVTWNRNQQEVVQG